MKTIHYNESFKKIPEEKRNRILESAINEFAEYGFDNANINKIAKSSGISIGSMYSYFSSKEELFSTIISYSVDTLKSVLDNIMLSDKDIFSKIKELIKEIQSTSRSYTNLVKLYNHITSENRTELIYKIISEMESFTASLYKSLLEDAQKSGVIRKDIDTRLFAFFLDNLFISLQFSYSCEYYKERLKLFINDETIDNDELVAEQLLKFIQGGFSLK